ncbi:MAG: signal peptidase II [Actinomycetales bacterium]
MAASRYSSSRSPLSGSYRSRRGRRALLPLLLAVAAVVVVADQVAKAVAVSHLDDGSVVSLVGGHLVLRLVRNPGAAFGLAAGATIVFSLVALVVIVAVLRVSRRLGSRAWAISLGLLLGGALGNLVDRLVRPPAPLRGHVVDFLHLPGWPIIGPTYFNLADTAIVFAGLSLVVYSLLGLQLDGRHTRG